MKRRSIILMFALLLAGAVTWGVYLGRTLPSQPSKDADLTKAALPNRASIQQNPSATPVVSAPVDPRLPDQKPGQPSGQEMLEQWMSSSTDSDRVGLTIMQNFFQLPEKDHVSAMLQLVNLVRDPNISGLERILLDPRTSPQAKDRLFEDIKIRPYAIKLPIFLNLMQKPEHPQAQDAHDILSSILGGEWGKDYGRWQKEIERAVKEQG